MTHASVLVALSPDNLKKHKGDVKNAVDEQMAPFDENGEWFKDGSRWDWWVIGGRFTGKFAIDGYDPHKDLVNQKECWLCNGSGKRNDRLALEERKKDPAYTCNGCDGSGMMVVHPSEYADVGNVARRGELDEKKLLAAQRKRREESWNRYEAEPPERKANLFTREYIYGIRENETKEEFIQRGPSSPVSAYAFLKDREWHECGRMGFFGMSTATECELKAEERGEKWTQRCIHTSKKAGAKVISWTGPKDSEEKWGELFWARFIRNLDPNYLLVVVDYHV